MSEHIFNVAFDFDDNAVRNYVETKAISDVRDAIISDAREHLPRRGYGCDSWEDYTRDIVKEVIDEHEDEIVGLAAVMVAQRVERRKAWKEALADARAELEGGNEDE